MNQGFQFSEVSYPPVQRTMFMVKTATSRGEAPSVRSFYNIICNLVVETWIWATPPPFEM